MKRPEDWPIGSRVEIVLDASRTAATRSMYNGLVGTVVEYGQYAVGVLVEVPPQIGETKIFPSPNELRYEEIIIREIPV